MKGGLGRLSNRLHFIVPPFLAFLPLPHGTNIPLRRKPVVTIALVWINIAIFLGMFFSGREDFEAILEQWGYVAADNRILTLFTYQFLHGGFLHLFGNMLFLWIFGANVEDRLGRLGFLAFYLACGVAAILFFVHVGGLELSTEPCAGASGSIYGVMGAFFVLFPLAEIRVTFVIMILVFYWRIRTFWVAAFFIAPLYIVMNLLLNAIDVQGEVAFMAHVGGFLFAIPCALVHRALFPVPRPAPPPEMHLEEDKPKPPQSEPAKLVRDLQEALYAHLRPQAIQLYEQGKARYGALPLAPVDRLALGEAMVWEERYHSAVEVYRELAKNRKVDPALRTRAALEVGRLYIGPLGDVPRGVRVFRRSLERFPYAGPSEDIRRELAELEQRGYPLDWRTPEA